MKLINSLKEYLTLIKMFTLYTNLLLTKNRIDKDLKFLTYCYEIPKRVTQKYCLCFDIMFP